MEVVAIDCEMVGVGFLGREDMLARVSIVDSNYFCLYDKFVKPTKKVIDYRTNCSGVREKDLVDAESFETVQNEVKRILNGKIVVGHDPIKDYKVLGLYYDEENIRDTSEFGYFRSIVGGRKPSLKRLAEHFLKISIQRGEHDSVEDAKTTMKLYRLVEERWEKKLQKQGRRY